MKTIQLTQGQFALVDDEDFDELINYKWLLNKDEFGCKAYRRVKENGKVKLVYMHRHVMKVGEEKILIDHIDHDGLNNQKSNLRRATYLQNNQNKRTIKKKYKGAYFKGNNTWLSSIKHNKKQIHLGSFRSEIEAAKAYDEAAKKYHGEFAYLNFRETN